MGDSSSITMAPSFHTETEEVKSSYVVCKPFVSVVIPCYNSRTTISECLTGLEAQTYPRDQFEIIVADNGSTDGSRDLIMTEFPQVHLLHASQRGSGYARNSGITAARGRLILSTDCDCVADPNWIVALVEAMEAAPSTVAAIGGLILPYSQKTLVERYRPAWVGQPTASSAENKVRYTATPNAIFHAGRIREVGSFDGTLGFDDTDLGLRLRAAGYSVLFSDSAVVRHRNPVTLSELYRHRRKYAQFFFALAQKHPDILGNPHGSTQRRKLLSETLVRLAKNMLKLPLSMIYRPHGHPAGWPVADSVMAWANYKGYAQASMEADKLLGAMSP